MRQFDPTNPTPHFHPINLEPSKNYYLIDTIFLPIVSDKLATVCPDEGVKMLKDCISHSLVQRIHNRGLQTTQTDTVHRCLPFHVHQPKLGKISISHCLRRYILHDGRRNVCKGMLTAQLG